MKQLLIDLNFKETYKNYFVKDAPGKLGYFLEVLVDLRFNDKQTIKGKRGNETEFLFQGIIGNKEELEVLLKQVEAI